MCVLLNHWYTKLHKGCTCVELHNHFSSVFMARCSIQHRNFLYGLNNLITPEHICILTTLYSLSFTAWTIELLQNTSAYSQLCTRCPTLILTKSSATMSMICGGDAADTAHNRQHPRYVAKMGIFYTSVPEKYRFLCYIKIWNTTSISIIFTNSVKVSQKTNCISITDTNQLILFKEMIAVYLVDDTNSVNTPCGQKYSVLLMLK